MLFVIGVNATYDIQKIILRASFISIRSVTVFTRISAEALIQIFAPQVRRLSKHFTIQIYFFYIFIQRSTLHLLIFLWTDTKLIVNLELREKFTR